MVVRLVHTTTSAFFVYIIQSIRRIANKCSCVIGRRIDENYLEGPKASTIFPKDQLAVLNDVQRPGCRLNGGFRSGMSDDNYGHCQVCT